MYYLWLDEAQAGPFTLLQVQSMWKAGKITSLTLYWQEGKEDWQPLGNIQSEIEPAWTPPIIEETVAIPAYQLAGAGKASVPYSPGAVPVAPVKAEPELAHWTGHPTWWKWAWWLVLAVGLALATGALFFFFNLPLLVNVIPACIAVVIFLYVFFDRRVTRYTVTNKRVTLETGIFSRKSRELRIQDIRSIAADMNILGYGDIEFSSAASDDADVVFNAVAGAAAVRDLVKKLQA